MDVQTFWSELYITFYILYIDVGGIAMSNMKSIEYSLYAFINASKKLKITMFIMEVQTLWSCYRHGSYRYLVILLQSLKSIGQLQHA